MFPPCLKAQAFEGLFKGTHEFILINLANPELAPGWNTIKAM